MEIIKLQDHFFYQHICCTKKSYIINFAKFVSHHELLNNLRTNNDFYYMICNNEVIIIFRIS